MGHHLRRGRFVVWLLVIIGVVYLTVAGGGGFFGLYNVEFRVASVLMMIVALVVWLAWAIRHPEWRPRSALWPAIVACLAALVISTLASSEPRFAYDYLAYTVLLAGGYLLMQRLFADPFFGPRLAVLGVLLGFGLSGLYIGAVALQWVDFWTELGRFSIPPLRPGFVGLAYGNPSPVATVTILLWLAAAAHLGLSTTRTRVALTVLGAMTAAVVFLSGSRGAWVGLVIASAFLIPLWLAEADHRRLMRTILASGRARLGIAATGLVMVAIFLAFKPAIVSRVAEHAADTRTAFYVSALRMFADQPMTGLGPGTWTVERIRYTVAPEADYYIPHAHNIFLQTLAELGIAGALAGFVMLVAIGVLVWRGARSSDPLQRRLAWAVLAGTVYLGAHQLFDFYPNMPAIGFVLALAVARLDASATGAPRASQPRVPFVAVGTAIVLGALVAGSWLARAEGAATDGVKATLAANAGDWDSAYARAQAALDVDPDMPPYLFTAGLAAAHLGDLATARDLIRRSAEIDDFPTAWVDLARVEADLGNPQAARAAVSAAMRLGYQQPQIALAAADLYLNLRDRGAAVRAATSALIAAPGLAGDPIWRSAPWSPLRDEILQATFAAGPPDTAYLAALSADRFDEARTLVAAIPETERTVPRLMVEAWNGDRLAFDELHALAVENPIDQGVVALCRWVAGVATMAHPASPWTCDRAGWSPVFTVIAVAPPPISRVALPGPNSSWHFQYVYRRTSPIDELVPGLPHLAAVYQ